MDRVGRTRWLPSAACMALFILCSWTLERTYHQRSDAAQLWHAVRSSHEINESVALEIFSRTKKIVLVVHRLPSPERLATIAMYRPFFHTVVYLQPQNSPDAPGELLRAQERATLTGRLHANEVVRTPSATMGRVLLCSVLRRSKNYFPDVFMPVRPRSTNVLNTAGRTSMPTVHMPA